jgi:hypothetical protein
MWKTEVQKQLNSNLGNLEIILKLSLSPLIQEFSYQISHDKNVCSLRNTLCLISKRLFRMSRTQCHYNRSYENLWCTSRPAEGKTAVLNERGKNCHFE